MQNKECSHSWEMVNKKYGFINTEKCFDCGKISTYYSKSRPPLEEYRDKDHFWNVVESAQTVRFDLQCTACKELVEFKNLMGLMMCTGCEKDCEVDILMKELEPQRIWVYVAFGFLPVDERTQVSQEQINILQDYFNQRRKSDRSSIKFVSNALIKDYSVCYAEIIRDVDLLSLTPPEVN
jgi:hypothetical protein